MTEPTNEPKLTGDWTIDGHYLKCDPSPLRVSLLVRHNDPVIAAASMVRDVFEHFNLSPDDQNRIAKFFIRDI